MKYALASTALMALEAAAFPTVPNNIGKEKRQVPSTAAARALSASRGNCGVVPCTVFNAQEQYVSTSGEHAYAAPAQDEIRGPCPGLNAAANHGYLSRSGVTTLTETITGLGQAFGMSADLGGFLAAYAIIFDGNPLAQTWSIGGPPPPTVGSGLLGTPGGITWSHNKYEGDTSIGRFDAYLNNGDAHSLNIDRFKSAYEVGQADGSDRYTLDKFAQNFASKVDESISTNPYYFAAPFSTTLVSPAAYNFVINFMSNHTAEEPNGYLNGEMFKQFFAVEGDYPNFTWKPGQERFPDNWYRRTSTNQYNAANVFTDLGPQFLAYPGSFRLGGNTNGVNTYEGVELEDLTGGAFSNAKLFDPNNPGYTACFYASFVQAVTPDFLSGGALGSATKEVSGLLSKYVAPIANGIDCPPMDKYNAGVFSKFPGYKYSPTGPATNY